MVLLGLLNAHFTVGLAGGLSVKNTLESFEKKGTSDIETWNDASLNAGGILDAKSGLIEATGGYKVRIGNFFIHPELVVGRGFANTQQKDDEGSFSGDWYGGVNLKPGMRFGAVSVYAIGAFRMARANIAIGKKTFQEKADTSDGYVGSIYPMTAAIGAGLSYAATEEMLLRFDATYGFGLKSTELKKMTYDDEKFASEASPAESKKFSAGSNIRALFGVEYSF